MSRIVAPNVTADAPIKTNSRSNSVAHLVPAIGPVTVPEESLDQIDTPTITDSSQNNKNKTNLNINQIVFYNILKLNRKSSKRKIEKKTIKVLLN